MCIRFLMFSLWLYFRLTNCLNTAQLADDECRENSAGQNGKLTHQVFVEHFFQVDIVIEVQWTSGRKTENGDIGYQTVLEVLVSQVRVHKPKTSDLEFQLHIPELLILKGIHLHLA